MAIGFGAQSLVKDYFTGFFLLLENQLTTGDVVEVADRSGIVEDVTLRYVRLRDYDGNVHFVPNNLITTVKNMSRGFAQAVMDVGVAYRENIDEAFDAMRAVGSEMRSDTALAPRSSMILRSPVSSAGTIPRLYCGAGSRWRRSNSGVCGANSSNV